MYFCNYGMSLFLKPCNLFIIIYLWMKFCDFLHIKIDSTAHILDYLFLFFFSNIILLKRWRMHLVGTVQPVSNTKCHRFIYIYMYIMFGQNDRPIMRYTVSKFIDICSKWMYKYAWLDILVITNYLHTWHRLMSLR